MKKLNVKREDLLSILIANKLKHEEAYNLAMAGFQEVVLEKLREALKKAETNTPTDTVHVVVPKPVCYLADYERAIKMVEMNIDDPIELDHSEFDTYFMDNWQWKRGFIESNIGYTNKMSSTRTI